MFRTFQIALVSALILPLISGARTPAFAASCSASKTPSGYIGQKWNAFGGAASALGCPTDSEHNYESTTYFSGVPQRGRSQDFEHGQITWYPTLGAKMTLSTWWNGSNKMHFDFSDVAPNPPKFVVLISNLAGNVSKTFEYPGGPGHNRDIDLGGGMDGSTGLWIRLMTCTNDSKGVDCPPHMINGGKFGRDQLVIEDPHDAPQVVSNQLFSAQVAGSDKNNTPPVAVAPVPDTITFDANDITLPSGFAIGGNSHVTMHRDGRVEFQSHFHDSGALDYYYSISWVVAAADGTLFTLHRTGHCEGHSFPPSDKGRSDDNDPTATNVAVSAHWAALAKHHIGKVRVDVKTDFGSLYDTLKSDVNDVEEAMKTAEQAYQAVQTVVAVFA